MKITIVIPAHNEAENIRDLVLKIQQAFNTYALDGEIIIVDDNSYDGTKEILQTLQREYPNFRSLYRTDGKCGVGKTLKEGFAAAQGDIVVTLDCDLSHDPETISELVSHITNGADLVIGSRYTQGGEAIMPLHRKLFSGLYNLVVRVFLKVKIHDLTTGYRAVRRDVLRTLDLKADGFEIHPEIHLAALSKGFKVVEFPIKYSPRLHGSSKLRYLRVGPDYVRLFLRYLTSRC